MRRCERDLYTYFKRKEDVVFAISHDMFREIYEKAQSHDGPFMDRLTFYMVTFSGHIERDGLKLCQEWVRNTVDPDLVENPYDKEKLRMDNESMRGMLQTAVGRGGTQRGYARRRAFGRLDGRSLWRNALLGYGAGGAYSFEERT